MSLSKRFQKTLYIAARVQLSARAFSLHRDSIPNRVRPLQNPPHEFWPLLDLLRSFKPHINHLLHDYLKTTHSTFIDDVLVFSDGMKEHIEHVEFVLAGLHERAFKPTSTNAPLMKPNYDTFASSLRASVYTKESSLRSRTGRSAAVWRTSGASQDSAKVPLANNNHYRAPYLLERLFWDLLCIRIGHTFRRRKRLCLASYKTSPESPMTRISDTPCLPSC